VHTDEYFEYLLEDPSYFGEEMFVMCQLGRHELSFMHDQNLINVYNKMHVSYKVRVEWGIWGLKRKWGQLIYLCLKPSMIYYTSSLSIMNFFNIILNIIVHIHQKKIKNPT
jgi:hypothetical protein